MKTARELAERLGTMEIGPDPDDVMGKARGALLRADRTTRKLRKLAKEMEDEDHGDLGGSARSYVRRELLKILETR